MRGSLDLLGAERYINNVGEMKHPRPSSSGTPESSRFIESVCPRDNMASRLDCHDVAFDQNCGSGQTSTQPFSAESVRATHAVTCSYG